MIENREQEILLKDRKILKITSVISVKDFTPNELIIETSLGLMLIAGDELRIESLSKEEGIILIAGRVDSIEYKTSADKKGFLSGLFKWSIIL